MEPISITVAVVLGVVVGASLAYLLLRSQHESAISAAVEKERGQAAGQIARTEAELQAAKSDLHKNEVELELLRTRLQEQINVNSIEKEGRLAAEAEVERQVSLSKQQAQALNERIEQAVQLEAKLKETVDSLARQALKGNNEAFIELAKQHFSGLQESHKGELELRRQAVEELVKPINEKLQRFERSVQEIETKREGAYSALSEQIKHMMEAEKELRSEAQDLSLALRGKASRWGNWGEMQLRRAVELAGMQKYVDFTEQQQVGDAADRPDLIVRLPNGKHIIVDSKAVTEAFMPVAEAHEEAARIKALKVYAAKVRERLKGLASKSYWEKQEGSPDFVIMFLPGETFFTAAVEADPELMEYGVANRVILATPLTLIAMLRAVAYGWQEAQLAENAKEIHALGKDLYNRVSNFTQDIQAIGAGLTKASNAYNEAVGSLESRLLPGARKFKELGAGGKDEIEALRSVEVSLRRITAPELLVDGEPPQASPGNQRA